MVWALREVDLRPHAVALLLIGVGATCTVGCARKDCETMSEADRRDWCYYERVVTLADKAQLEPAISAISQIDSAMVRAFATERLISVAPEGLTVQRAEGLCNALPEPHRSSCVKSWTRPHLWEGTH